MTEGLDERTRSMLTGVRSGKQTYYAELQRTKARLTSAVHALERISEALVRTRDDPRSLLEEVLRAAAEHLRCDWTMIALHDGALTDLPCRFLAATAGTVTESADSLPGWLAEELASARTGTPPGDVEPPVVLRVSLTLEGADLGRLIAGPVIDPVEHADRWILRILANQAAMSMHTATLYATGARMRREAQDLYDEIARSSQDLRLRTAELARAEGRLRLLHDRELLDAERHRIALDLHDSVAQYVLSAGLAVDVCRAEATDRGDQETGQRLAHARDLIAKASDQVRSVVFALRHSEDVTDDAAILPELLKGLVAQERPDLDTTLRLEGRPSPLPAATAHGLARIAGEALFNISLHARASRAAVRLRYTRDQVSLWISDDGEGDPARLGRLLRLEAGGDSDGRHQGLASMSRRAGELGGTFRIRRASIGGVRIEVRIPAGGQE